MKNFGKLLALCLALMSLVVCMALGGCKKTESQDPETGDDAGGTTTAGQFVTGTTVEQHVGDEVVLPDDDGDVIIEIEGTTSSSTVGSSKSSSKSSTSGSSSSSKNSSSGKTTDSTSKEATSQNQSSANTSSAATKSRAPGETPRY